MIEIVEYQASWTREFQTIAARLREQLGSLAVRIDHIGSTAVPGLAAKDVIDVQITVAAFDERIVAHLTTLGYQWASSITNDHEPPGCEASEDEWRKWFFRAPVGERATNTHVRQLDRSNQRYPLLFRDYLRTRPATCAAYAELKRRLARELKDPDQYPDVKDPAVDLIFLAARDWAGTIRWRPGDADA